MKVRAGTTFSVSGFLAVTAAGLTLNSTAAFAQDDEAAQGAQRTRPTFTVFVGGDYSDNIDRQPMDGQDELTAEVGGTLAIERESSALSLNIAADGSYRNYTRDTFDNEFLGGVSGAANIRIIPDRFEWAIEDDFGQAQTDLRQVQTADNRGNVNRISTGPTITLPISGANYLSLTARYEDVYYEERDDDYDQTSGDLGLVHAVSANRSIGVYASASKIEYDIDPARDADIRSVYLRLASRAARSELALDVGYNEVSSLFTDGSGELIRVSYSRELSSRFSMEASASRSFSASGDTLRTYREIPGSDLSDPLLLDDRSRPVELTSFALGFSYDTDRTHLAIGGAATQEDAEDLTPGIATDRKRTTYRFSVSRDLAATVSAGIYASYDVDDFDDEPDSLKRTDYGAELNWALGRHMAMQLSVGQNEGDSGASRPDYNYTESVARLRLIYAPRK